MGQGQYPSSASADGFGCYLHCPGGPEHLFVGLLPRFPCPVSVVVVVWQLVLLQFPTGVGPDVQTLVPLSLVKVPPAASHCCCEGDADSAGVVAKATNDIDPSNINIAVRVDIVLLLGVLQNCPNAKEIEPLALDGASQAVPTGDPGGEKCPVFYIISHYIRRLALINITIRTILLVCLLLY